MLALVLSSICMAQQPMTAEELEAILTFREQHLSVREVVDFIPGTVNVVNSGWGWGPRPYWGWGMDRGSWVTVDPPRIERDWAVYQGLQRLSVPSYLNALDRDQAAEELRSRIRTANTTSDVFSGIGWLGLLGGVTGTVLALTAPDFQGSRTFAAAGAASTGTGVLSSIVGGAERKRASSHTYDFDKTQELPDVQRGVREHHELLRRELDLTPGQAFRELASDAD